MIPRGAQFKFLESPFRVKGVLYQGTQAFFNDNLQAGIGALVAEIASPELRDFITQPFLASGWYDALPVPALVAYEARALRMTVNDYSLYRTRYQARRDLGGVYAWVLRIARPQDVALRLPAVMVRMFDFAKCDVACVQDGTLETIFRGIPAPLEPWLRNGLLIYAQTALKLAGAKTVELEQMNAPVEGERAGVPLVMMHVRLRWS
ncbi:MAG: hypothetical protein HOW73_44430 [Polyangiaceae bacterium]|nr:hypothetical protein [Polyangiaceae bacterium]